ncbi:MAG: serine/threonine-protein kinase [Phycisphaerales bacterium]
MAEPEPKQKGDLVEGYRILAELGRGAASIIYLVQDPKTKQVWALKHVEKRGPKEQRFLDQADSEYRVSQAVGHAGVRHIEKVIKKGSLLSVKELYLVMELVDGVSLHEMEEISLADAVDVFRQVASGMAAMHDAGYVHADMKPHNVIVGPDFDGKLIAKIIDLGQACKMGTVKQRIQGTPDYIAPEQVHRREITGKTDIYNLGATMYWVLTHRNIPTAMGAKPDSLVGSLDDSLIEKPRPARELNPEVPERLSDLIAECVEVMPDKRPASMHKVADRLDLIYGILRAAEDDADAPTDVASDIG